MNPTVVYHGAWLAFAVLAIILGAVNIAGAGFQLFSALLVAIGLLFGARSVHALFLTDEPGEIAAWQAYLAIAVLVVMVFIIVNEWVL